MKGLILGGVYLWSEIFQIDWANLIVEGKFTVFALFNFVLKDNLSNTSSREAYI